MAKKSAKSKGYRNNAKKKKPYLTKRDIIILIVIVAVIALAILLFNLLYDDGTLDIVDGVVQVQGENSLIVNTGTGRSPIYYKIGQVTELEGYDMTSESYGADDNVQIYTYTPQEDSDIETVTISSSIYTASQYASTTLSSYTSATGTVCSDLETTEIEEHEVQYFTFYRDVETAIAASLLSDDEIETDPLQELIAFVDVGDHCITIEVLVTTESEDDYVDDSVMIDVMNEALTTLSFETK